MKALLTGEASFEVDSGDITVIITRKEGELLLAVRASVSNADADPIPTHSDTEKTPENAAQSVTEPLPDEYWHSMNKD